MYAIAGIAIPVIIHLWNNKRVRTLKIGSVRFLEPTPGRQARSRTLSELLLLLLRCLLLIVLALLLAGPYWKQTGKTGREKGWLLMEKKNLTETYSRFKPVIDSLLNKNYELHYFDRGFAKTELRDALKAGTPVDDQLPYWTLFRAVDQSAATDIPFYIFSTNNITRFKGPKPVSSRTLHWQTYTAADSSSDWIQQAWLGSTDSIYITAGKSKPSGNTYIREVLPKLPRHGAKYETGLKDGRLAVAMTGQPPVPVDTATLKVTIYSGKYALDARYLQAAIEAIQQFSGHKLRLYITDSKSELPSEQDWLFWLSEEPVHLNYMASHLFIYAGDKGSTAGSWMKTAGNTIGENEPAHIYKLTESKPANLAETIWEDGFGKPLLTLENKSGTRVYRFFSHFDPAWNDLVWDPGFPSLLLDLIFGKEGDESHDRRTIDAEQAEPLQGTSPNSHNKDAYAGIDLTKACWVLLFIIFVIERMISFGMIQYGKNG